MSTPATNSVFPVVIVVRGKKGDAAILNTVDERTVFECTAKHAQTIRYDVQTGRLNVWVTDAENRDEFPYPFQVQLAHARLVGMSETEIEFEGVEVEEFHLTGRTARVILTNAATGWINVG